MKIKLLFAFCLLFAQQLSAQNLLKNGQFNDGIKHWTVMMDEKASEAIKAQVLKVNAHKKYGLADNYVKTNFVELDAKTAIKQTVKTKEGESYTLVFAYAHRPNAGDKQLIVSMNGKPIYTKKIANADTSGTFQYKHLTYKAKAKSTTIEFYAVSLNGDESMGVLLTDVVFNKEEEVDLELFNKF